MSYEEGLPRILSNQGEGYQNTILLCCMLFFVGYPTIAMLLWSFLLFFSDDFTCIFGHPSLHFFLLANAVGEEEPQWSAICGSFIARDISNLSYIYIITFWKGYCWLSIFSSFFVKGFTPLRSSDDHLQVNMWGSLLAIGLVASWLPYFGAEGTHQRIDG